MAKSESSNWTKVAIWAIAIILIVVIIFGINESQNQSNQNTHVDSASAQTTSPALEPAANESAQQDQLSSSSVNLERLKQFFANRNANKIDTSGLDSAINSIINQNPDIIFGVSIKYLNNDSVFNYGYQDAMTAASVTKVLTAVDYLKQVELGIRSLDTVMANGYSAQYNIEQMIVVSDNDAWHILNEDLGYTQMQDYAHSIGLSSYDYTNNSISSADTAKLLADMYERKLINEPNSQLLLSYMERANYRDLIIPAVPTTDTVYHKAGEYLVNLNDAAIITNGKDTVVLSIFTESTAGYSKPRVADLMQQITAPTLETFNLN